MAVCAWYHRLAVVWTERGRWWKRKVSGGDAFRWSEQKRPMNRSQLVTVSNANVVLIVFVFETRPAQLPLIPRLMRFTQFRKCFFSSCVVYLPFVQSWKTARDWHNALCLRRESDTGNYRLVWFKGLSLWYFVFVCCVWYFLNWQSNRLFYNDSCVCVGITGLWCVLLACSSTSKVYCITETVCDYLNIYMCGQCWHTADIWEEWKINHYLKVNAGVYAGSSSKLPCHRTWGFI